jgi:hypothetical protein
MAMADPVTLVAVGVVVLVSSLGAYRMGRRKERQEAGTADLFNENQRLVCENDRLQREARWRDSTIDAHAQQLQAAVDARDKYRAMAETHEVKLPEVPEPTHQTGVVWEGRRFNGHPEANLKNMTKELKPYKGRQVRMLVTVNGESWSSTQGSLLAKRWQREGKPTRLLGPFEYNGPAERCLQDFDTWVRDLDTGLTEMKRVHNRNTKVWADTDSPLTFSVDLEVTEVIEPPPLPQTQLVEVAVVEREVQIVEVEKPIFVSIPEGQTEDLCGHTKEEIREMVDEVLQRKVADEEVEALGRLIGPSPESPEEVRQRAIRARAAGKVRTSG